MANKWPSHQGTTSRSRNMLGFSLGNLLDISAFPWLWDLHLTAWFQRSREVRYRLEIAISIPHWRRLANFEGFLFLWSIAPNGPYPESELTDFKLHQTHLKREPVKFKASSRSAYLLRDNHGRVAFQVASLQIKQKGLMHYLWMMCLKNLNGA